MRCDDTSLDTNTKMLTEVGNFNNDVVLHLRCDDTSLETSFDTNTEMLTKVDNVMIMVLMVMYRLWYRIGVTDGTVFDCSFTKHIFFQHTQHIVNINSVFCLRSFITVLRKILFI